MHMYEDEKWTFFVSHAQRFIHLDSNNNMHGFSHTQRSLKTARYTVESGGLLENWISNATDFFSESCDRRSHEMQESQDRRRSCVPTEHSCVTEMQVFLSHGFAALSDFGALSEVRFPVEKRG